MLTKKNVLIVLFESILIGLVFTFVNFDRLNNIPASRFIIERIIIFIAVFVFLLVFRLIHSKMKKDQD